MSRLLQLLSPERSERVKYIIGVGEHRPLKELGAVLHYAVDGERKRAWKAGIVQLECIQDLNLSNPELRKGGPPGSASAFPVRGQSDPDVLGQRFFRL
jgi:hypothetical protein